MTEPDVTLTDYFLAAETALFVVLLQRRSERPGRLRTWFSLFFGSLFVAALCGGTFHGFFQDIDSTGHNLLWLTTLLALGITTLSAWSVGADLLLSRPKANWVVLAAVLQLALYTAAVLAWVRDFWIALVATMPAMLFLMVALGAAYRRERGWPLLVASGGIAFTFLAGAIQHLRFGFHPQYLSHNALAHVIQSIALLLLFWGALHLVNTRTDSHANTT